MSKYLQRIDLALDQLIFEAKETPKLKKPSCFLSQKQIDEHYEEHYLIYIKNLKEARSALKRASEPGAFRTAAKDVGFYYNAVNLHKIYFESLGQTKMNSDLEKQIGKSFGSKDRFMDMLRMACLATKNGWAVLGVDLDKTWNISVVDSHDLHVTLGCPLLTLDVWEHAYYVDYQADKEKYINALIEDVNWESVAERWDTMNTK